MQPSVLEFTIWPLMPYIARLRNSNGGSMPNNIATSTCQSSFQNQPPAETVYNVHIPYENTQNNTRFESKCFLSGVRETNLIKTTR